MRLAREKKHENGILGIPMSIHRHGLAIETIKKFINFQESDKISRSYLGKKDCVTVREKGSFKKKQKLYGPFLWMRFNCLKARATSRRQFTF